MSTRGFLNQMTASEASFARVEIIIIIYKIKKREANFALCLLDKLSLWIFKFCSWLSEDY